MDSSGLVPLLELLDDNIDDLEEALKPLLSSSLVESAGKLPLLDKAQLYVLVTYAIESVLFSYLRLDGVNARDHPVFRELARVKQYFEKIQNAEKSGESVTPNVHLDKAAANRFIKHALAGNAKHDQIMAKELEERKLALQRKLALHKAKPSQGNASLEQTEEGKLAARYEGRAMVGKRKIEAVSDDDSDSNEDSSDSDNSESSTAVAAQISKKGKHM